LYNMWMAGPSSRAI